MQIRWQLVLVCTALLVSTAEAQFVFAPGQIPQGSPFNNSSTDEMSFGDVDNDGDLDAAFADGGDCCNDQNRLWVNQGGAQGGNLGFFVDVTAAQFPAILDDSRDIEFGDIDGDGDSDLYVSNTSTLSNQPSRWWVNMGGVQGGSLGFYADETAARWLNIAVNDGVNTFSSIAPGLYLPSTGGFVDWAGTAAFADFDNDGDLDLFHGTKGGASSGTVPARIFLNNGAGYFEEFNPSGFQLSISSISNGNPALWAQGTYTDNTSDNSGAFADITTVGISVDIGDADRDFDLDVLYGHEFSKPRLYRNNNLQSGVMVALTDVSTLWFPPNWSTGSGAYEAEFGDLDDDGDIDIFGNGWASLCDTVLKNQGNGVFGAPTQLPSSCSDDEDQEFLDYDNDGDLDVLVANFSGQERMYANSGSPNYTLVLAPPGTLPADGSTSRGVATGDIDLDGDVDAMIANDSNQPNTLLKNLSVPMPVDVFGPRITKVESVTARIASADATSVRALIYDNVTHNVVALQPATLEYSLDGGAFVGVPMSWSGGQVFRGKIPGQLVGQIVYRVTASDAYGNNSTSLEGCYAALASGCTGTTNLYCTAKVNSQGCTPVLHYAGAPSVTGIEGFHIQAFDVLNNKFGLFFYSLAGQQAVPFQGGTLCVKLPIERTQIQNSIGNPPPDDCSGQFYINFGLYLQSGQDPNLISGIAVDGQFWSRDPGYAPPNNTGLTGGIHFVVCP